MVRAKAQKKESTARQAARIIDADLYIKRALMMGIANASAVAELIRKEHLPGASFVAIKAAVCLGKGRIKGQQRLGVGKCRFQPIFGKLFNPCAHNHS